MRHGSSPPAARGRGGGDARSHNSSDPRAQQSITINPWALMNVCAICIIHTVAVILLAGGLPSATFRARDDPPGFFSLCSFTWRTRVRCGWYVYRRTIITSVRRENPSRPAARVSGLVLRTTRVTSHSPTTHPATPFISDLQFLRHSFAERPSEKCTAPVEILAPLVMTHRIMQ